MLIFKAGKLFLSRSSAHFNAMRDAVKFSVQLRREWDQEQWIIYAIQHIHLAIQHTQVSLTLLKMSKEKKVNSFLTGLRTLHHPFVLLSNKSVYLYLQKILIPIWYSILLIVIYRKHLAIKTIVNLLPEVKI